MGAERGGMGQCIRQPAGQIGMSDPAASRPPFPSTPASSPLSPFPPSPPHICGRFLLPTPKCGHPSPPPHTYRHVPAAQTPRRTGTRARARCYGPKCGSVVHTSGPTPGSRR
eukprot:33539-Chlamydomonas_euryale.AAC.1